MGGDPQVSLLRALIDQLPAMVAYWDKDQRCRIANRAYLTWFGVEPEALLGKTLRELLGPIYPLNLPFIEGALRGQEQQFERELPNPEGGPPRHSQAHYTPHLVDGEVRGFFVLVVDITRRIKAEEVAAQMERQLRTTERLAALATLAAGVTHEINSPLMSVAANIGLALEDLASRKPSPAHQRRALRDAQEGTERISGIIQGMRQLARGDTAAREEVEVNEVLQRSISLAARSILERAHVVRDLGPGCRVLANAAQLAQVFVNLLVNAAQAVREDPGTQSEIRVSSRSAGGEVVVEVADNGRGIPPEQRARIFEPLFTTKVPGVGSGLGLAISSTLIRGFGGRLSLTSEVGVGSVFRVTLPALPEDPASPEEPAPRRAGRVSSPGKKR